MKHSVEIPEGLLTQKFQAGDVVRGVDFSNFHFCLQGGG